MLRISVHKPSKILLDMSANIIDSPHEKSIKFLRDVCQMDGIDLLRTSTIYKITVRVRGRSGRHYEVVASRSISLFNEDGWQTTVTGGAWKNDFNSENTRSYTANLCLNTHGNKRHLPIGDRLASLVLSLHDDLKLAMDIPLVAQFIVCPREDLYHIYTFQDDMIVTQDMIDEQHDFDEEYDFFEEDETDDFDEMEHLPDNWFVEDSEETEDAEEKGTWAQDLGEFIRQHIEQRNNQS